MLLDPTPLPSPNAVLRRHFGVLLIVPSGAVPHGLWRFQVFASRGDATFAQPAANMILHDITRDHSALMAIRQLYGNQWGGLVGLSPAMMEARLRRDLADGILFAAFYIPSWDFTGFVTTNPVDISGLLADPPGTPLNWSPAQRIAAMFRRIPGCMTVDLQDAAAALLTPKAIALLAALTVVLAASQGFVVGAFIDGILISAAWAYMRWQGLLALKDFIAAIIAAAGETSLPGIQADAQTAAHALDVLGLNFLSAILLRAADQEKVISLEKPAPDGPLVVKKPPPVVKGWKDYPSTAEQKIADNPTTTTTTPELGAPKNAISGPAQIDWTMARYARPAEQATAKRLADAYPEFNGRTFTAPPPPDPGYDWMDDLGQTYDAMGDGTKSQFFKLKQFTDSISSHLLKGNNFTIVDLTGYTDDQIAGVRAYVDALTEAQQAMIRRIGF
jgi:hypothetical protein